MSNACAVGKKAGLTSQEPELHDVTIYLLLGQWDMILTCSQGRLLQRVNSNINLRFMVAQPHEMLN